METLDVIVLVSFALAIGWYAGWVARGIVIITNLARDPERMIKMLEEIRALNIEEQEGTAQPTTAARPKDAVAVWAEELKGLTYIYTVEKNEFVGQGPSLHDALVMAAERYPNKTFWLDKSQQANHTA